MTKSYSQIVKQIESLKVEAERLRKQEVSGVISRIRDAIAHYGLTAADLGLTGKPGRKAMAETAKPGRKPRKPAAKNKSAVAKFRDENGNSWVGRGKRPQWLRDALAGGKKLEDFAVQ
jgi:DNA-binding protein H-NS